MGDQHTIDIAIIGAGPAGMTAALYGSRAGWQAVVFEQTIAGGQLGNTARIDNYPGFPEGVDGFQLGMDMDTQAKRFGAQTVSSQVLSVDLSGSKKIITTATDTYHARTVILATGASARTMQVPGEEELRGRGVSYCATCDGNFFRGKDVIVYGGANTAVEDSLYLAKICHSVTIVYRRDRVRATAIYTEAAEHTDNIRFRYRSVIDRVVERDGKVGGAIVRNIDTGNTEEIPAAAVFVAIGSEPNSALFANQVDCDQRGYVKASEDCETSVPGVFVAGDLRTKPLRQVVTAVSDGAVAAEAAAAFLTTQSSEHL
ncbi:MAG: thioredoxin-disulfide reductase [Eggerthellaceae bacterium]|jgi:thioredoxin reductase (NADPH)